MTGLGFRAGVDMHGHKSLGADKVTFSLIGRT